MSFERLFVVRISAWGQHAARPRVKLDVPQHLVWYDPDASQGRGRFAAHEGMRHAMAFGSREDARLEVERVPRERPTLADGTPNQPLLRCCEVEIVEVEADYGR